MPRLDTKAPKYDFTHSPLYRLNSRKKLAELLHWSDSPRALDEFASREDNYKTFTIKLENKKPRPVQEPKDALRRLHRRLAILLLRIAPPDYLHSGLGGRSFVTNALSHVKDMPAIKLDVKRFYPSTKWAHVFRFFRHQMKCSPDVAGLLATIACFRVNGDSHIPTGSCLSQILAYYCHKTMFDEINNLAKARGGEMTVYVDDITISMPDASPADIRRVGRIITRQSLAWHKQRFFPRWVAKRVTGTIVKSDHIEADKKHHFKYRNTLERVDDPTASIEDRSRAARSAIGILQSIAQIDKRQAQSAKGMSVKLRSLAI